MFAIRSKVHCLEALRLLKVQFRTFAISYRVITVTYYVLPVFTLCEF